MHGDGLAKGTFRKVTQEFCAKIFVPRTLKLCTFLAQPFYTYMRVLYSSGTKNMFAQTNYDSLTFDLLMTLSWECSKRSPPKQE